MDKDEVGENIDQEGEKYFCPETGAHFEYQDICRRLVKA